MRLVIHTVLIAMTVLGSSALTTASAQSASKGKGKDSLTACKLLSSAEAAKLTGRSALASARQIGGTADIEGSTGCGYVGSSLYVELAPLESIESFSAAAQRRVKAGEFQPYAGLGDAAWFRYNKYLEQHGFVVRVGRNLIIIMMDTREAGSSEKVKAQLLPLAKAAAAKLK